MNHIFDGRDTITSRPQNACIHQLFEMQVERSPEAIAVVFENTQLTYRQLNQRANQLAHHLSRMCVGPEVKVSICLERSLEMVVGLLGILKAGGAYVPIDPVYHLNRLAFILEDAQTPVLLTQEKLLGDLPHHQAQVLCLDTDWELIAQNSQENPVCKATADNLMYTIYTSGSTGQPKGVMISHRGVYNNILWRQATFNLTPADKVLQTISLSFDPSVWQIFWSLCFGAILFMARPGGHQDTSYIVDLIRQEQITVIALVPSLLRVLLEEPEIASCQCLKHLSCGGETLPIELIEKFFAQLNLDGVLHNMYGPTETSIDATFWTCQRQTKYATAPIGRAIANTQIYILDENLQPVPDGELGELHISGPSLARGYLNLPKLTAAKFIPHPFSTEPDARLYKTGDLARYLPDGNIEFLGRMDYQVKIRGFRIELAEIEAVLREHPALQQNLVIAREDIPGDKRLVAYVVTKSEAAPSQRELCHFLQHRLPNYMVPTAFVFLDTLPLNPNGKIDRHALPMPDPATQELEDTFVADGNQVESQLIQIWERVLGVQPIGIRHNFFDLGGNSLLAAQMFGQIKKTWGYNLPLTTLFQSNTVEALAQIICQQEESVKTWSSLVEIQPQGSKPPLFCIHPLGGEIFCYWNLSKYLGPEQPVYGLQPPGLDGKQPLLTSVEDMATLYIQEIRTIQPQGPYFLSGYSFGGVVAYEMAKQLQQQGEKIGVLAAFDTCIPGSSQRLPFPKRVTEHLVNLYRSGPAYLWQKIQGWSEWGSYLAKRKAKTYLEVIQNISDIDEHIDIIGANARAADNYIYSTYPGTMILFRTEDKNRNSAVGVRYDPLFGWGDLVTGGLEVHYIPGSHDSVFDEPHIPVLASKFKDCLTQAQQRVTP